ncbi:MAG: helix-turn-helix domain-containing protein [Candidatus Flemingiibacterium sp.]
MLIYRRDLSVTEIGVKVGIPDTSYFIKCFRRSRGMTPNKFREMNTRKI